MRTQAGSGSPMATFRGYRSQYGAGIGNVLGGLLRQAVPLLAPSLKNIGQTLLNAGTSKIQTLIRDRLGTPEPSHSPQTRPSPPRKRRVKRKHVTGRRTVRRKRRTKADIFST